MLMKKTSISIKMQNIHLHTKVISLLEKNQDRIRGDEMKRMGERNS
jgi:hypothetical protein